MKELSGCFPSLFPSLVAGYFDQVALFHLVLGVLLRLSFEELWAGALGAFLWGFGGGISFCIFGILISNPPFEKKISQLLQSDQS